MKLDWARDFKEGGVEVAEHKAPRGRGGGREFLKVAVWNWEKFRPRTTLGMLRAGGSPPLRGDVVSSERCGGVARSHLVCGRLHHHRMGHRCSSVVPAPAWQVRGPEFDR